MGKLVKYWSRLKRWTSARSHKELALLAASAIVLSYFVMDQFVYLPQAQRLALADQQLQSAKATLAGAQASLERIMSGAQPTPADLDAQSEITELRRRAKFIDSAISDASGPSSAVGALIKNLIARQHPRVSLLSLKTIPVKSLGAAGSTTAKGGRELFRHGVELELGGAYLDLLAYLRDLESRSQGLLWSDARLTASNFPDVSLRVTIFVISNRSDALIS